MLNNYGGYMPNTTLDQTYPAGSGSSIVLFGNSGGPSFDQGNYPQVGGLHD